MDESRFIDSGEKRDGALEMARAWPGLDGRDMVQEVTRKEIIHSILTLVPVGLPTNP
jgi:hypothetical protein